MNDSAEQRSDGGSPQLYGHGGKAHPKAAGLVI